jgi:hypothetical protein
VERLLSPINQSFIEITIHNGKIPARKRVKNQAIVSPQKHPENKNEEHQWYPSLFGIL